MSASIFTGRRKTSVARLRISRGAGNVTLNGRDFADYLPTEKQRAQVIEPLVLLEQLGQWDIDARVVGGGTTGQAGALRHALARALAAQDPEWRAPLKAAGMLTRDARAVERKKYGLKKARRAPQFSKR